MSDETDNTTIETDPIWVTGHNDALEYAAKWIENSASCGYPDAVVEFVKNQAMSLRAAKREIVQQDFFVAIRNDPLMLPKVKEYWLSKEQK